MNERDRMEGVRPVYHGKQRNRYGRKTYRGGYLWVEKVRVGGKERVNRKGVYPSGRRKE